jgi:basic amino acid/polyamine antiporter, APA family
MNDEPREKKPTSASPRPELTLFDSTSIIVGIIVAVGIYRISPVVAQLTPNPAWLMGLWIAGGALSLIGALCYAELATTYPKEGGDYVYLTKAFGPTMGFLFAWCQLWIVRPGSIGAMAYAFAEYANCIWPRMEGDQRSYVLAAYATASIIVLTAINMWGVRESKWTQNVLTIAKIVGLTAIVAVGFLTSAPLDAARTPVPASSGFSLSDIGLAMVFVLFTYGGWNEMAYVSAEVRDPRKNILRALLLGTIAVMAVYVLVNAAFLHAVGFGGLRHSTAAVDVLQLGIGDWAGQTISLLICVSALGAINGQIFTGARIYYAMGNDHRLYAWLGRWNARRGTPICSLAVQGAITLALAVWFGLSQEGFESMVKFTTPVFWFFFTLVGISVFVLRYRDPTIERPYRVPGYPVTPLLFCLSSAALVYSSLSYAIEHGSWEALWSVGLLLAGVVACFLRRVGRTS